MSKLFSVKKIGVFCDAIKHHNETRKSGDTKVITLTLRVEPFDAKLATALADVVRTTLFKLNHPDVHPHILRVDFSLAALQVERQIFHAFASTDTVKATIAFDQVKISRLYVRTKKNANGYVLVFDATFGPVSKTELEYVEAWRGTQRAVSFDEAEPSLEFEDDDEDDEDDRPSSRATPMFETDAQGAPVSEDETPIAQAAPELAQDAAVDDDDEPARQKLHSHAEGRRKRGARTTH